LKTGGRWSKQAVNGEIRWYVVKMGGSWSEWISGLEQVVGGWNGQLVVKMGEAK